MFKRTSKAMNRGFPLGAIWVALALVIVLLDQTGYLRSVEQVATTVLGPVEQAAHQLGTNLNRYGDFLSDNDKLRAENANLRLQLQQAQAAEAKLASLSNQVDQLQKQLNFKTNPNNKNLEILNAEVLSRGTTRTNKSITINKGSTDGVERGKPVVDSAGFLVGRVYRVENQQSEVLLITDSTVGVNVYTQRYDASNHRVQIQPVDGTAVGQYQLGTSEKIRIERLQQNADIKPDDWVFTNGLYNTYPPNILVGKVGQVFGQDGQPEKAASVQPIADLDHVSQVQVVLSWGKS